MKLPDLPTYYYLDHFTEMLSFVRSIYGTVLSDEHYAFITRFESLSRDARCLLIRMVNRRGTVFNRQLFKYAEIKDMQGVRHGILSLAVMPAALSPMTTLPFFHACRKLF